MPLVKGDASYTLVQVSINDLIMVIAFAPIAAVRPTIFHEFFAAETDGTGAARAGADKNLGLIKEMHGCPLTGFAGL